MTYRTIALGLLFMLCGCANTPHYYPTIGMFCTLDEDAPYPHIWREKTDPAHVCAVMDEKLPIEKWTSLDEMHFTARVESGRGHISAEFSRWYDAEEWIGEQPMPQEKVK